ncbi:MAG TPA: amidohydrolase family protein [Brevundimonas sp.]|nr:amidohydrolase family protein [Caulobacter sp.]HWW11732.1 amidohydrolase family protein [Brevundimonas sp.]HWW27595.1 amidohydrolase family protein [Caulobacter sp.]
MAYSGPIVDPHMHLWDLTRHHYAWLQVPPPHNPAGDVSAIAGRDYGPRQYLNDVAGWRVTKVVHIECGLPPKDQLPETDWLQGLADAGGYPHGIVAGACLERDDVEALLEAHAARPNVRGVRQIVNWHADPLKTYTPRDMLQNEAWRRGFGLLAKHGLSFDLQLYPLQMFKAARLAADHPDVQIIVNHAGMPTDRDSDGFLAWRAGVDALSSLPNVAIKISGFGGVDPRWSAGSVEPFIHDILDAFGTDRAMFASNFPVDRVHGAFGRHYAAFDYAARALSDAERLALFAGNAERIYRI